MRLVITLPIPPRTLNPNGRGHWAKKSRVAKTYRDAGRNAAIDAMNRAKMRKPFASAKVTPVFYFKDARRRDKDNFLASAKSLLDGVADAGVVKDDSQFTYLPVEFKVDKADPRLELIIEGRVIREIRDVLAAVHKEEPAGG